MFPLVVQLAVARIADLNEYVLLSIGWAINLVRCLLLFDLFTSRRDGLLRWVFLPLLAVLVFLPSQIALYSFGFPSLQFFFSHLGVTAGLWILLRYRLSTLSVCLASCCGVFASWSSAIGVLCWPIFACTLLLWGHRVLWSWVITASAGIISISPYVYFVVLAPPPNQSLEAFPGLPRLSFVAAELGWAFFRSDLPVLEAVGLGGLVVMGVGAALYVRTRRGEVAPPSTRRVLAAVNLIAFGLLCAYRSPRTAAVSDSIDPLSS